MTRGSVRRKDGRIQQEFFIAGKKYVIYRQDPASNKIARPDNRWRDITNPYEKALVALFTPKL